MTVKWSAFAQTLTDKSMKGMLTGPVTILNWSFVRDDQPRSTSCLQLRQSQWQEYLDWAIESFKIRANGVSDNTQIHTHMCYSEFNYPNDMGPGVYDIHSPNIPTVEYMVSLMTKAAEHIPAQRLWVNPDCGLKTRGWAQVKPALENMVRAAKQLRAQ